MTAKTPHTRKGKGRNFQIAVAVSLQEAFSLPKEDVKSTPSGVPGADILLSSIAREKIPFYIECKHWDEPAIWNWIRQAEAGAAKEGDERMPLVVFRYNHTRFRGRNYAIMAHEHFMSLFPDGGEWAQAWAQGKNARGNFTKVFEQAADQTSQKVALTVIIPKLGAPIGSDSYTLTRWEDLLGFMAVRS